MLVIHGYEAKEVNNLEEAMSFIEGELNQHNLRYVKVFDSTQNDMRVLVYQYWTLYKETFLITDGYQNNPIA